MKKIGVLFLVFITCLITTGCGSNVTFNYDSAIINLESELSGMEIISDETLEDVYGLDLTIMDKYTFKQNSDGDFYAIIKTRNIDAVKDNMGDYFEKVQKFNVNYSPERIEILDNRVEKEIDDYLVYIVAENAEDIYNKITNNM